MIETMESWVSPRLGIRFQLMPDTLDIYRPDGQRFLTFVEIAQLQAQETRRAEQERQRADMQQQRAEREQRRAERLAEQLRALGVEPDFEED